MYLHDNGYIEIEDTDLTNLNILFGGRGIGKTFSVLKHRCENALNDDNKKFIWLRDSAEVVKKIAAGNSITNPIRSVCPNFPEITIEKSSGNNCFIANPKSDNYKVLGFLMALSTFHNARGISYEDVVNITWDEFIPEDGAVIKKNQGAVFLNAYESINRNREFDNKPPVQIIFLSNTNDIYSDVLADLGVNSLIETMMYNKETVYRDNDMWIEFLSSEVFYEKKKDTFIYRINKNEKFNDMALKNKFTNNMALINRNVSLKGATGLLTLSGRYTLIELSNGKLYWKMTAWKNLQDYDMDNDQEAILYRLLFNDKLRSYYITGKMYFDSIYTKRKILEYSRI